MIHKTNARKDEAVDDDSSPLDATWFMAAHPPTQQPARTRSRTMKRISRQSDSRDYSSKDRN